MFLPPSFFSFRFSGDLLLVTLRESRRSTNMNPPPLLSFMSQVGFLKIS
jgi:hypothetical protein